LLGSEKIGWRILGKLELDKLCIAYSEKANV